MARGRHSGTMMGMSSVEWSRYIHDRLGVADGPRRRSPPRWPTAIAGVYRRAAAAAPGRGRGGPVGWLERWPLAVASSSNRQVIDLVLELAGPGRGVRGDGLLGGGRAEESRRPTSTWRPPGASGSTPEPARRSRTRRTGFAAGRRRWDEGRSRSRTATSRPTLDALALAHRVLDSLDGAHT